MPQLRVRRFVAERKEPLLGAVERERDVGGLVVSIRCDRGCRTEEAPQDRAVADDAAVALDLGGGRNDLGERAEVGLAPDSIELLAPCWLRGGSSARSIDPRPPADRWPRVLSTFSSTISSTVPKARHLI